MTAMAATRTATAVRQLDHTLTAECWVCRIHLEHMSGADVRQALEAFRAAHPMTGQERHSRGVPKGWRIPLSGPGALSQ
jgi:hypothetical protein